MKLDAIDPLQPLASSLGVGAVNASFAAELEKKVDAVIAKSNGNIQKKSQNTVKEESAPTVDENTAKENKKLRQAAVDFESFFVSQLFSQMRKTVPSGGLFGDTQQEKIMQGMLDDEVSKNIANGRGMGLADMLYKQLHPSTNKKIIPANTPLGQSNPDSQVSGR